MAKNPQANEMYGEVPRGRAPRLRMGTPVPEPRFNSHRFFQRVSTLSA